MEMRQMTPESIDTTKLLGFDLKGEPLFDVVVPSQQDVDQSSAVGTGKAGGIVKADGTTKAVGASKLAGDVKN